MTPNKAKRVIINTVGISAIWNFEKASQLPEDIFITPVALRELINSPGQTDKAVEALMKVMRHPQYTERNSRLVSAEIFSLNAISLNKQDRLYFLGGDGRTGTTDPGLICAQALARYYEGQVAAAKAIRVEDFTVDEEGKTKIQPENFLRTLEDIVLAERALDSQVSVIINLTGGYKVGGIYAALVGLRYGCEIYYMYERMREPVGLPIITARQLARLNEEKRNLTNEEYENLNDPEIQALYCETEGGYRLRNLVDIVTGFPEPVWQKAYQRRKARREEVVRLLDEEYSRLTNYDEMLGFYIDPIKRKELEYNKKVVQKNIHGLEKELEELN